MHVVQQDFQQSSPRPHQEKRSEPIKNYQKLSDIGRLDNGGNTKLLLMGTVSLDTLQVGTFSDQGAVVVLCLIVVITAE